MRTQDASSGYVPSFFLFFASPLPPRLSVERYAAVGSAMEVGINLTTAGSNNGGTKGGGGGVKGRLSPKTQQESRMGCFNMDVRKRKEKNKSILPIIRPEYLKLNLQNTV